LSRFIEELKKKGSNKVSLDTDPRLTPAVRLYAKMGFTPEVITKISYGLDLSIYRKANE
jgi:GNAT superfamily N-acetyltransferase